MIKGNWIKKGAVVIDVGINRITTKVKGEVKNKLVGISLLGWKYSDEILLNKLIEI